MSDIEKLESVYKSILRAADDYQSAAAKPLRDQSILIDFSARAETFATVGEWLREMFPELKGGD